MLTIGVGRDCRSITRVHTEQGTFAAKIANLG
jgi:hypothetical protein